MRERYPGCRFFLFTNDRAWAGRQFTECRDLGVASSNGRKSIFSDTDVTWVDLPETVGSDYAEFVLMSRCKHHILANSSFSWWASYLNENPDQMVMTPDKWLNGWDCSDIYRKDMTIING